LVIGATVAIALGQRFVGVTTAPVPFPDAWTYRYHTPSLLVMAVLGGVTGALGFVCRAERQFVNYLLIGNGLGILLLGTSYLAAEKVEVAPDKVVYRSWWGLSQVELELADLHLLRDVKHHRPWRRNPHWESLHYQTHDGRQGTLFGETNRSRLIGWANHHLLHSAGKQGVEIRHEYDYGK
jgi:hypothetical protein